MRVLLINTTYGEGGAAIAVENLHNGLLGRGVETHVGLKDLPQNARATLHAVPRGPRILERGLQAITRPLGLDDLAVPGTFRLKDEPWFREADVINFHNLHGGYFNYLAIPALLRSKPAVLTLHDMWSFTGHCAYSFDCDRWRQGCGRCPYPDTYPSVRRDSTALGHRIRRKIFAKSSLHVVAISRWMEEAARKSLLSTLPIHFIPNGIKLDVYRPRDQKTCREELGLPLDKLIILYITHRLEDPRKGFEILLSSLGKLPRALRGRCLLLVLGFALPEHLTNTPVETMGLGYVGSPGKKASAYCAADLFAFPTLADNLPLVCQESLACGTPMVSFSVGGVPELVRDGETGITATCGDADEFAHSLSRMLEDDDLRARCGHRCREIAETEFSLELQIDRYERLFSEVTRGSG